MNSLDSDAINAKASALMEQGIALMDDPAPDALSRGLRLFDDALDLRSALPMDDAPVPRLGLAACWLNRADVLVRLGGTPQIVEAIRSYDEGIALARTLPGHVDPRFLRRLVIAHQNRGLAIQMLQGPGSPGAIEAFTAALTLLESEAAQSIPDREHLQAVVWLTLANARTWEPRPEAWQDARDGALRAMSFVAATEGTNVEAAEVGLKARHVLCRALASQLSTADELTPDCVHAATDTADEALELVRQWEREGIDHFRVIAYDVFRFGARVYAIYQPHFLEEFVRDNLDARQSSTAYVTSPEMRSAAEEARSLVGGVEHPEGP